jgi:hypothetical protein
MSNLDVLAVRIITGLQVLNKYSDKMEFHSDRARLCVSIIDTVHSELDPADAELLERCTFEWDGDSWSIDL